MSSHAGPSGTSSKARTSATVSGQASLAVLRTSSSNLVTPGGSFIPSTIQMSFSDTNLIPDRGPQSSLIDWPESAQRQSRYDCELVADAEDLLTNIHTSVVKKKRQGIKRNQSINQFTGNLRDIIEVAANEMESATLFEDPLPDPQRSQVILEMLWSKVEVRFGIDYTRDSQVDAYRDERFRFRAQEAIVFIHQEFFTSPKKLGNRNKDFITKINGQFICLIFTVLYHTLQCYETGEYVVGEDFNYTNSISKLGSPEKSCLATDNLYRALYQTNQTMGSYADQRAEHTD
ncbi:hypothetical protein BGX38DRAFT_1275914 [Terfezia claveryi]|nr:hypothetical protein BGX38DRAFT_1275914 [Terfezia claveryi]